MQYNLRYYSPGLGRFINRDPIGEAGGNNLYAYVRNQVANKWDYIGLVDPPEELLEGGNDVGSNWNLFSDGSLNGFFSEDFVGDLTGNDSSEWHANNQAPSISFDQAWGAYGNAAVGGSTLFIASGGQLIATQHGGTGEYQYTIAGIQSLDAAGRLGDALADTPQQRSLQPESSIYFVRDASRVTKQANLIQISVEQAVAIGIARGGDLDVFLNGQSNDKFKAARLGSAQLQANNFVLFHNPTHGGLADTLESLFGQVTNNTKVGREFATFLAATRDLNVRLAVHSQGGITANIGISRVIDSYGAGSLPNLSVAYYGAAVHKGASKRLLATAGATMRDWDGRPTDAVATLAGRNARSPIDVVLSLLMLPSTLTGIGSPHTNYNGLPGGP